MPRRAGGCRPPVTLGGGPLATRWELAAEYTEDLRGIDARICQTRNKLAAAVRAAGTGLTGLFGVGEPPPIVVGSLEG
jgi:hypothetical protein